MERKQQQHRQQQPQTQQRDGLSAVRDRRHESFVDRQKRFMQEALVCFPAALVLLAHEYARPFEGIHTRTLKGHTGWVWSLVVLPTGELASGSGDKTIRVWNTDTGECKQVLKGHTNTVLSLVVLPTGELASASYDKTIRV